jgi:hypothetical protein
MAGDDDTRQQVQPAALLDRCRAHGLLTDRPSVM